MKTTRRGLFGLFAGAVAAPHLPPAAEPIVRYTHRQYALGFIGTKPDLALTSPSIAEIISQTIKANEKRMVDTLMRENSLLKALREEAAHGG